MIEKFICIAGPDGAGKSTVAQIVKEKLKRNNFKVKHLGQTYILHNRIKLSNKEPKADKKTERNPFPRNSKLYDFIANIVMTLELSFFFFIKERLSLKKKNILMDHAPHDVLVENNRRRFKTLEKILFLILPQPDHVYVLKDSPENIRKRKKQRTKEEIVYYYKNMTDLLKKSRTPHTVIKVEDTAKETAEKLIKKIKKLSRSES